MIAVRAIFGKKMSAGLRYALWGLVLLRLLVPGTVFSSPVSVKTAVQGSETVQNIEAIKDVSAIVQNANGVVIGQLRRPAATQPEQGAQAQQNGVSSAQTGESEVTTAIVMPNASPERFERMQKTLAARDILNIIWYTGMALAAAYFIAANLRFYLKLRARRQKLDIDASCPVYSVEGLNSSCLFLNSIYISKENADDPTKLNYVIEHEKAHRRHGDSVFALLRSAALVLHWYNPLVWVAAFLSRRDSELFADAGAIKAIGEAERADYGRTLIELSSRQSVYAPIACAATMMTSGKRELKSRITGIARRRKMGAAVCAIVLVLAFIATGFTFLGGRSASAESGIEPDNTAMETKPAETAAPSPIPTESAPEVTPVRSDISVYDEVGIPQDYSEFVSVLSAPAKYYTYDELSSGVELGGELTYLKSIPDMEMPEYAPQAFCVTDSGEIVIADTIGSRLMVYDAETGAFMNIIPVCGINEGSAIRVTSSDGVYYVLIRAYNPRIIAVTPDGASEEMPLPQLKDRLYYSLVTEFYVDNGRLILTLEAEDSSGETLAKSLSTGSMRSLYNTSWTLEQGTFTVTRGDMSWSFPAQLSTGLFKTSIQVMQTDADNNLYVVQQVHVKDQDPYGLFQVYDKDSRLIRCAKIEYFMDSYETVRYGRVIGADGCLYEMHCNEDAVEVVMLEAAPTYRWQLDIDGDGETDFLTFDANALCESGLAQPVLKLADGTELTLPAISTSRAAQASYAITELDGHEYVLYYQANWYNGAFEDYFTLYAVENGELKAVRNGLIEFAASSARPVPPVDTEKILAFVNDINELWQHSRLVFTTDTQILGKSLYGRSNGARYELGNAIYMIVPDYSNAESFYYVEELQRLVAEFGLDASDPELTAGTILERVNEILLANYTSDASTVNAFIELTWPTVTDIMKLYGCEVDRDNYSIQEDADGVNITFFRSGAEIHSMPAVSVTCECPDDSWAVTRAWYYPERPADHDWGSYDADNEALPAEMSFSVSAVSVSDAAWNAAQLAAEWFTELPEGNVFRCTDAAPVIIATAEYYSKEHPQYTVRIAFMPEDYLAFSFRFGDFSDGLCVYDGGKYLCYTASLKVVLTGMNTDGSYNMTVVIPDDGPLG